MSKLKSIVAIAVSAALITMSGCSKEQVATENPIVKENPNFESDTTMDKLANAGTMTVGSKFDQALFGLKDLEGNMTGFDVEIAKIIGGELGIAADKIKYTETPSAVREEAVISGKADMVIATYFITDERRERISFAGPYYVAETNLMVNDDNDSLDNIDNLKGGDVKVCSAAGAGQNPVVEKEMADPEKQMVLFDTYTKCADALRNGQVDAVVSDSTILLGLVAESDGKFKIVGDSFQDQPFGVGIKKGDVEFCKFINDTLTAAYEDGRYETAWKKTAGTALDQVPELPKFDECS